MATTSYPAVGDGGLTAPQFAILNGSDDGIYEDYMLAGVQAAALTTSGDTVAIAPARIKVNGYLLDITTAEVLSLPAVTVSTTYYIAAMYDPNLNVADSAGNASLVGPCRLVVTAGAPSTAGGKAYTLLYTILRAPGQTLAVARASGLTDYRQWIGPLVTVADYPSVQTGFGPWPRGTRILETDFNGTGFTNESVRTVNAAGTALEWRNLSSALLFDLPTPASLVSYDPAPSKPSYIKNGDMVTLEGTLQRSTGAALSTTSIDVILATLPVGYRPGFRHRFIVQAGPVTNQAKAEVRVDPDGNVTLNGDGTITWVDLSPVHFRIA